MKILSIVSAPTNDQVNAVIGANLKNVVRWSTPVPIHSAGLGTLVSVSHDLMAIPNRLHVEHCIDSRCWADQDDRKMWTDTVITFRTSHPGVFIVMAGVQ